MITDQIYQGPESRSADYISVLPQVLHLDPTFVARRFDRRLATLFKDVTVVKLGDVVSGSTRHVWNSVHGMVEESQSDLLRRLRERLKACVFEVWNPAYPHAVMHSSGLDSRMLSWTIKQLHIEHGDDWLGDVLFLCSRWEGESFKAIMQYEGWEPHQYWVPREDCDLEHYYEPSLTDFQNVWRWSNGASAIAVNLFWWPVQLAQQEGRLPTDNVQLFTGQWGNTTMDAGSSPGAGQSIKDIWKMFYYSALFARPMKGDQVIHPYADDEYAKVVAQSSVVLGKELRPLLCQSMDERLAQFVNMQQDGDRHRRIADGIINKMIRDYDNSWYGKRIPARPQWKTTEFQPFWSRWTAASLCEHLLEHGYEIRMAE